MKLNKLFLIVAVSTLPVPGRAQVTDAEILRLVAENDTYVRQLRRHFHEHPEVGGSETETVRRLKAELKQIGEFEVHDVPGSTGFYAILDTHRPGPTIGLRTDIDGLPVVESMVNGGHFETTLPDDFTICTDKQRVRLILEELLDNANKFTHQGIITVSCSQPDDKTVAITVSDTGIGIAKADREMIFAPFAKVDLFTAGVGLGLPLSQRAAQRIGGDLVLDPKRQEGASFILTIPISK